MITPKEALESAVDLIADCIPDDLVEKPEYLRQIKAAIPVAELHEEIAEVLLDRPSPYPYAYKRQIWWDKVETLRTKLEALK